MKITCIIQARLGSDRLPKKVLADIGGKPMVQHVYERARYIGCKRVILAVPRQDVHAFMFLGADIFTPPEGVEEWDVLERFRLAARWAKAEYILRVTADCPLLPPEAGRKLIARATEVNRRDYVNNDTARSGWPDGCDVELFSVDMLERAAREATDTRDREHVTTWMKRATPGDPMIDVYTEPTHDLKLSVDTEADLKRVRAIHACLPEGALSLESTLAAAKKAQVFGPDKGWWRYGR